MYPHLLQQIWSINHLTSKFLEAPHFFNVLGNYNANSNHLTLKYISLFPFCIYYIIFFLILSIFLLEGVDGIEPSYAD